MNGEQNSESVHSKLKVSRPLLNAGLDQKRTQNCLF